MANTNTFNQALWTFDEALKTFNGDDYTPSSPAQEGGQILYFTAAAQAYVPFRISAVVWASDQAANKDIAAGDEFLLTDRDGNIIVGKEARSAGDGLIRSFYGGIRVNGVVVSDLDGGVLYVYGQKL